MIKNVSMMNAMVDNSNTINQGNLKVLEAIVISFFLLLVILMFAFYPNDVDANNTDYTNKVSSSVR
jgi:hypothetical protein